MTQNNSEFQITNTQGNGNGGIDIRYMGWNFSHGNGNGTSWYATTSEGKSLWAFERTEHSKKGVSWHAQTSEGRVTLYDEKDLLEEVEKYIASTGTYNFCPNRASWSWGATTVQWRGFGSPFPQDFVRQYGGGDMWLW